MSDIIASGEEEACAIAGPPPLAVAGPGPGDAALLDSLLQTYYPAIVAYTLARLGNTHDAEDVAQETFVRAWRHAHTYDARRGRVATWILTIARNLAIDRVRVKRVEPLDPDVVAGRLQRASGAGALYVATSLGRAAARRFHEYPPTSRTP